jgi:hypothetical protein
MPALPTDRQGRHNPQINAQAAGRQEKVGVGDVLNPA